MKTSLLGLIIFTANLAFAGESYSPKSAKTVVVPPMPIATGCGKCLAHTGVIAGGGIDYFFDNEAVLYTGQLGYEWANATGDQTHAAYAEVGWASVEDAAVEYDIVPVTLNYRYTRAISKCLNLYFGGGLGVAFTDSEFNRTRTVVETEEIRRKDHKKGYYTETVETERTIVERVDESEAVFLAQIFAGVSYCVTDYLDVYAGARYVWTSDIAGADSGFNDFSIGVGALGKF